MKRFLRFLRKKSRDKRGSALLVSLMVIVGLSLLGLGFVAISETESAIAKNQQNALQTQAIAESGARVVAEWFQDPTWAETNAGMPQNSVVGPLGVIPAAGAIGGRVATESAVADGSRPASEDTAATGAAALTPHFSSSCFTRPAISRTVRPLSCSTIVFVSAILFSSHAPPSEASEDLKPTAISSDVFVVHCRATAPVARGRRCARPTKLLCARLLRFGIGCGRRLHRSFSCRRHRCLSSCFGRCCRFLCFRFLFFRFRGSSRFVLVAFRL